MKYEVMSMNQEVDSSWINSYCPDITVLCSCGSSNTFYNYDYMCNIPGHYHYCDYSLPL